MAVLVSVNVGMPRDVLWEGRTVHTGIWKSPQPGPRMARRLNIVGDGQVCGGDRYGIREAEFGKATADEPAGTGATAERLTAPAPDWLGCEGMALEARPHRDQQTHA